MTFLRALRTCAGTTAAHLTRRQAMPMYVVPLVSIVSMGFTIAVLGAADSVYHMEKIKGAGPGVQVKRESQ